MLVVASGYFDPLHIGHIEYLNSAKLLGDKLIVLINSDEAAIRKKGYVFMSQADRIKIISELKCVDEAISAMDQDNTVAESLQLLKPDIFAKGGDRDISNLPLEELKACKKYKIKIVAGLGNKIASSSALVDGVGNNSVIKSIGKYNVQLLYLYTKNSTSIQNQILGDVLWTVLKGKIKLFINNEIKVLSVYDNILISRGAVYHAENVDSITSEILEIQL